MATDRRSKQCAYSSFSFKCCQFWQQCSFGENSATGNESKKFAYVLFSVANFGNTIIWEISQKFASNCYKAISSGESKKKNFAYSSMFGVASFGNTIEPKRVLSLL